MLKFKEKMTKKSINLRKLVKIGVTCLVMSVLFLSCDKDSSGNNNNGNSGTNEQKLVGHWRDNVYNVYYDDWEYWHLYFNKDGTFVWFLVTITEYSYKGNYSVSDGKIYFTNLVFTNDDYKTNKPDTWVAYIFATDSQGKEQLRFDSSESGCFTGSSWWYREQ